ncbi:hypothetical protein E143388_08457 [Rhodococcus opacus]|nr:hypothetical protein E143388_07695 [Rhodococcus opacus]CAG7642937.1 hypothetical protein E143388_08457 [Rhodococcus opacus]
MRELRENHGRHPAPRKARPLPDAKVVARQERWWYHRYPFFKRRSPIGAVGDVAARVPVPHRANRVAYSPRIIGRICLGRLFELNFSFSTGSSAVQSPVRRRRCTFDRGFGPRSRRRTEYRAHRENPGCADMPCRTALIPVPVQGSTHRSRSTPWRRSSSRPRDIGPGRAPRTTWLDRACSGPRHPQGYTCPPAPVAPRVNDPHATEVSQTLFRDASTVHNVPTTLVGPPRSVPQLHPNECAMLSLRNPPPVLIAPLHAAVPVLIHDEFMCVRLPRESEIVCAGITTANRRYLSTLPSRSPIARRGVTHSSPRHRRRRCLQGLVARFGQRPVQA